MTISKISNLYNKYKEKRLFEKHKRRMKWLEDNTEDGMIYRVKQ